MNQGRHRFRPSFFHKGRTVESKPLSSYFKPRSDNFFFHYHLKDVAFFVRRRELFNKISFIAALCVAGLMMGPFHRGGFLLLVALLIFVVALYLHTRAIAQGIFLEREIIGHATENEILTVKIKVTNASQFRVDDILIVDQFSGSKDEKHLVLLDSILPALTHTVCTYGPKCDAGMGLKYFGPMMAIISDPLGIFEFHALYKTKDEIDIYPDYNPIPKVQIPESFESRTFGPTEGTGIGQSTNFYGTREYVPGDPIKQISWRLSARRGKVIIKELENNVLTNLTVILDMEGRHHVGYKAESTWEVGKDLVIALLRQQIGMYRRIQFVSQDLLIPFGLGEYHVQNMVRAISTLKPKVTELDPVEWIGRTVEDLPFGSTLLYVGPVFRHGTDSLHLLYSRLQARSMQMVAVYIDASSFMDQGQFFGVNEIKSKSRVETSKSLNQLLEVSANAEIPTYVIRRGIRIADALMHPAVY